ncbi:hypothetical protein LSM04_007205 [Trypanosoma melophagium]|uniref:uncharacterized protein n=1 Tax=Trypanosoma melophagium TaxID=715481 RepID=UPI00351A0DBA|nr:hypothetical protein LSM04_007205 [Trypanosoma melophagium]
MDEESNTSSELYDVFAILKESAKGQWDIDADDLLLKTMMMMQAKFMARFGSARDKVDGLYENTHTASIQLQNAMNSFLLLSQKQFVQNRVSVEDTESETISERSEGDEKNTFLVNGNSAEDMEARVTRVCQEAIDIGVRVLEERTIPLFAEDKALRELPNTEDSVEDERDSLSHSFANHYRNRHLMALIGSEQFLTDPYTGFFGKDGRDSRRSSRSESSSDSMAEPVAVDVRRDMAFHTDTTVPADTTTRPAVSPAKLPPPATPSAPPPPPPPPARTAVKTTTVGGLLTKKAHDPTTETAPRKTGISAFLDSSDSSDDDKPLHKPVIGSRPTPGGKKIGIFPKASTSSESTSSESSDRSVPKVPVKPVSPRKTNPFVSDLSSDSENTKVPPVSYAKKAVKVPARGIFSSDDSSSSEYQYPRAKLPPKVVNSKANSAVRPDVALHKTGIHKSVAEHSDSKESSDSDTVLAPKFVDLQTSPSLDKVPPDDSAANQNEVLSVSGGNHDSVERIEVSPSVPLPSVVGEQRVPGVVPPPVSASIPLPKRGGKALSTSSSDTEEPLKGGEVPPEPPRMVAKKVPPPPPRKLTVKTAPPLYSSSSSDLGDTKPFGGTTVPAPRKMFPKVTFSKRHIYSSDSDA